MEFESPVQLISRGAAAREHPSARYVAECNDALARLVALSGLSSLIGARIEEFFPPVLGEGPRDIESSFGRIPLRYCRDDAGGYGWPPTIHVAQPVGNRRERNAAADLGPPNRDITELNAMRRRWPIERRLTDLLEALHMVAVMIDPDEAISLQRLLYEADWVAWGGLIGKNWF